MSTKPLLVIGLGPQADQERVSRMREAIAERYADIDCLIIGGVTALAVIEPELGVKVIDLGDQS